MMAAVENPARMSNTGDNSMRDPGVFTVVYSRAPSPHWPSVDEPDRTPSVIRRETETPRLPAIRKKPPLPRDIRMLRGDGLERSTSQTDLRKGGTTTRLPEPGKLNNGLSRSCNSVNKSVKPGTPSNSPASVRKGLPVGGIDREATTMNTELHRRSSLTELETVDSPTTTRRRSETGNIARGQDTSRTLHKSSSVPHSLASKDSKLSSNSSYSTLGSSHRPKKTTSQTSRKLSVVSGSPASQRKQTTIKQSPSMGSLSNRSQTQLTIKTLKNNNASSRLAADNNNKMTTTKKSVQNSDKYEDYVDEASPMFSDKLDREGYPVRIPDGMTKESFDICWNWVSSVEAARNQSQCYDMVMDSMVDWSESGSTVNSETS